MTTFAVSALLCSFTNSVPVPASCLTCSDGIVRWVKKKTGPAAATIEDKDGLAAAEKESEVIVIGYFKDFKVRCN